MSRAQVAEFVTQHEALVTRPPEAVLEDLDGLEKLLAKWQRVQNLVSRETPGEFWSRHVLDSLQILPLMAGAKHGVDLGSGGGFPALPLAIAAKGGGFRFDLVDSNGRKCAFLNAARRTFDLDMAVYAVRIEAFQTAPPDVITARALAALPQLMGFARNLAGPDTSLILHKGRDFREELAQLDSALQSNVVIHPSLSGSDAVVLEWPAGSFLS